MQTQGESFKSEILQSPTIKSASLVSKVLTGVWMNGSGWQWDKQPPGSNPLITYYFTDHDFKSTFRVEMLKGNFFSDEIAGGSSETHGNIVINETLARIIGSENPVGMNLVHADQSYTVAGVVKNFNFKTLHFGIEPMIIFHKTNNSLPSRYGYLLVRIDADNVEQAREHVAGVCESFFPGYPFELEFMDDVYGRLYNSERWLGRIFEFSAGLMILISCMGLLGLAAFISEQRTREIGIRKVLGASVNSIVRLLCRDIMVPVIVACVLAWLVSFVIVNRLILSSFAYQAEISWWLLGVVGLCALLIAILVISIQTIRSSQMNPVETLRQE
jgi:ABC-type lipoprotein release transport system permease subunit